jgi:hypothetical protein
MTVAHQQGEAEPTQQPFDDSFPLALLLAHLQELACKYDFVLP